MPAENILVPIPMPTSCTDPGLHRKKTTENYDSFPWAALEKLIKHFK